MVEWTAQSTLVQWEERWQRGQHAAQKRAAREHTRASKAAERAYKESRKQEAEEATAVAEEALASLKRILTQALGASSKINFESLKKREVFGEPAPAQPAYAGLPQQPPAAYRQYAARPVSFFAAAIDLVSKKAREERLAHLHTEALALREDDERRNATAYAEWRRAVQQAAAENARRRAVFEGAWREWQRRKSDFERQQADFNRNNVEAFFASYRAAEPPGVEQYFDRVLSNSIYPDYLS